MEDVQIILSGFWVALMLTYLLGDVLRIFVGNGDVDANSDRYASLVSDFTL